MNHPKLRKELLIAVIFSVVYFLLSMFNYHLDKFLPGVRVDILRYIVFTVLILLFVSQLMNIARRRKKSRGRVKLRFIFYVPALVLMTAMLYSLAPKKLKSENLQSKVILRGCYDQSEQKALLVFRSRGTFELKWENDEVVDWYSGTYTQKRDSLFLLYYEKKPPRLGTVMVNAGSYLLSVDKSASPEGHIPLRIGACD